MFKNQYPIDNYHLTRRSYTHGVDTHYNDFHLGEDLIVPEGTPIYAFCDGFVEIKVGNDAGNYVEFHARDKVFRFLHLSKFGRIGRVERGGIIGYSGNTGLSTAPHIHFDISRKPFDLNNRQNFIDPAKYFAPKSIKINLLTVDVNYDVRPTLNAIEEDIKKWTNGKLKVQFVETKIQYDRTKIEWVKSNYENTDYLPTERWVKSIIEEHGYGYDVVMFFMEGREGWKDYRHSMARAWFSAFDIHRPIHVRKEDTGTFFSIGYTLQNGATPHLSENTHNKAVIQHELLHILHGMTGQKDDTHFWDIDNKDIGAGYNLLNIHNIKPYWDVFVDEYKDLGVIEWVRRYRQYYHTLPTVRQHKKRKQYE